MVSWTVPAETSSAFAVAGKAGMIRCIPSVPQAVTATINGNGACPRLPESSDLCHSMSCLYPSEPFTGDAKHGCKQVARTRTRAALEPGRGDRLGHRVWSQRWSSRPAAFTAAGAARRRCDPERAERRRNVHWRDRRTVAYPASGAAVRNPRLPAHVLWPRHRAVPGDEAL